MITAALILAVPTSLNDDVTEVRVAFDGDAVLFEDASERVFQDEGLDAFQRREVQLMDAPLKPGPLEPFLRALHTIQQRFPEQESPVRTALVTARDTDAGLRVINTLRHWGVRLDESFFFGGLEKHGVIEALRPHIYFDDQLKHLEQARQITASAHVRPSGNTLLHTAPDPS